MTDTHRYVGNAPQEIVCGDRSLMVGPGEFVSLTDEDLKDVNNTDLLNSGRLLSLSASSTAEVPKGGDK